MKKLGFKRANGLAASFMAAGVMFCSCSHLQETTYTLAPGQLPPGYAPYSQQSTAPRPTPYAGQVPAQPQPYAGQPVIYRTYTEDDISPRTAALLGTAIIVGGVVLLGHDLSKAVRYGSGHGHRYAPFHHRP